VSDQNQAGFLRRSPGSELGPILVAPATGETFGGDASEATLSDLRGRVPDESGTWAYSAGTSGTVAVAANRRVIGIAAAAVSSGATVQINGGDTVPVPENMSIEVIPRGNLVAPTIVFTGTASYFVESVL
jgi:hypothetical protein